MTPENAAVVRELLAAARAAGATHRNVLHGRRVASRIWQLGDLTVVVKHHKRDWLAVVHTPSEHVRIDHPITSAQQVADLLGAKGIELVPVELTSGWAAAMAVPVDRATAHGLGEILDINQMRRLDRALLDLQAEYGHHEDCDCKEDDDPTCQLDVLWTIGRTAIDALGLTATRKESRS